MLRASRRDNLVESRPQRLELSRTTHERRWRGARARASRPDTEQPALGVQLECVAAEPRGGGGHAYLARSGVSHRSARLTHDGADQNRTAVFHKQPSRADGKASIDVPAPEDLVKLDPGPGGSQNVVFTSSRGPEGRDQLDTRVGRHRATVARDDIVTRLASMRERCTRFLQLEVVVEQQLDDEQCHRSPDCSLRSRSRRWGSDCGILVEDHQLQRPGFGGRLEPEQLVERAAQRLVGIERFLLTPRAIQSQH